MFFEYMRRLGLDPGQVSSYAPSMFYPTRLNDPMLDYREAAPPGVELLGGGAGAGLAGALSPAMAGTWQNLKPPKGLQTGGALSKKLQEIADTVRSEPTPYAGASKARREHGLEHIGAGAYKQVYRLPTQESQPLAVAIQTGRTGGYQGRDVVHPGSVRGVVPIWWYERGMPRQDVRVFAMPEIEAGRPVPGRTSSGSPGWYKEPQALDTAEIIAKMQRRGMNIGDLHSGNLLPEWSEQHGRFRPVVVDRGAMYPDTQRRGYDQIRRMLEGNLGFSFDIGNRQVINELLQNPIFWPALAEYITNNPGLASGAGSHWPMSTSAQLAQANRMLAIPSTFSIPSGPTPPSQARSTWGPPPASPIIDLTQVARSFHSPGQSYEAMEDLLKGFEPQKLKMRTGGPRESAERDVLIDFRNRVGEHLKRFKEENPSRALTHDEAFNILWEMNRGPERSWWRPMFGQDTPLPIQVSESGNKVRDLALEHIAKRQQKPSWVKQPSPFFKVTSSGPKDPWSRAISLLDEPDSSWMPWESPPSGRR